MNSTYLLYAGKAFASLVALIPSIPLRDVHSIGNSKGGGAPRVRDSEFGFTFLRRLPAFIPYTPPNSTRSTPPTTFHSTW